MTIAYHASNTQRFDAADSMHCGHQTCVPAAEIVHSTRENPAGNLGKRCIKPAWRFCWSVFPLSERCLQQYFINVVYFIFVFASFLWCSRMAFFCDSFLKAIPHKDCATDASSNFSSDETKSGVNTWCIHEHFCEIWREICKQMACKVARRSLCGIA